MRIVLNASEYRSALVAGAQELGLGMPDLPKGVAVESLEIEIVANGGVIVTVPDGPAKKTAAKKPEEATTTPSPKTGRKRGVVHSNGTEPAGSVEEADIFAT